MRRPRARCKAANTYLVFFFGPRFFELALSVPKSPEPADAE